MSALLPRISRLVADGVFDSLESLALVGATNHPLQVFAPVGGQRASEAELLELRAAISELAAKHGYPDGRLDLIAFDREAARVLQRHLDLTWAEAGAREAWSFVALVLLPEVTDWRFGKGNRERWVGSDLTRHTWGRLWWQAAAFAEDLTLLDRFTESDLNQLLERRSIGGDPRLLRGLAVVLLSPEFASIPRRYLIRDATARALRRLAFVDARSLDDPDVARLCDEIVRASAEAIQKEPNYAPEP